MWGEDLGILEHVGSCARGGASYQARTDMQLPGLSIIWEDKHWDKRFKETGQSKGEAREPGKERERDQEIDKIRDSQASK